MINAKDRKSIALEGLIDIGVRREHVEDVYIKLNTRNEEGNLDRAREVGIIANGKSTNASLAEIRSRLAYHLHVKYQGIIEGSGLSGPQIAAITGYQSHSSVIKAIEKEVRRRELIAAGVQEDDLVTAINYMDKIEGGASIGESVTVNLQRSGEKAPTIVTAQQLYNKIKQDKGPQEQRAKIENYSRTQREKPYRARADEIDEEILRVIREIGRPPLSEAKAMQVYEAIKMPRSRDGLEPKVKVPSNGIVSEIEIDKIRRWTISQIEKSLSIDGFPEAARRVGYSDAGEARRIAKEIREGYKKIKG